MYMLIKIFHLINVIVQFYALNAFLETADYPLFGGHVLYDLLMVMINMRSYLLSFRIKNGETAASFQGSPCKLSLAGFRYNRC